MFFKGRSCALCKAKFSETDDIVACPVCGAAHHRACWEEENRCALHDKHGTPEQYSISDEMPEPEPQAENIEENIEIMVLCPYCGKKNPSKVPYCTQCGRPLSNDADTTQKGRKYPFITIFTKLFDPLGGVPADTEIDGIPVTDIATFVGPNSNYYVPRFHSIKSKRFGGINLPALIIGPFWMLFRRMIAVPLLYIFYYILYLFAIMNFPEQLSINKAGLLSPAGALYFIYLAISLIIHIFANNIYMKYVIRKIKRLKKKAEDEFSYKLSLQKSGGTRIENLLLFWGIATLIAITLSSFFPDLYDKIIKASSNLLI